MYIFESNILTIEDCHIVGFDGTETFTNLRTGTLNISYSTSNELVFTSSSAVRAVMDKVFTDPDGSWVVEFDMKATGYDGGRIGIKSNNGQDTTENSCVGLKTQSGSVYAILSPTQTTSDSESSIGGYSSYNHYKIIAKDGVTSLYRDGVLKKSKAGNDWLSGEVTFYLHGWTTSNVIYIKNYKAKHYPV